MDLEKARSELLQHSKSKINGVFPIQSNFAAKLTNPLCGDSVEFRIYLREQRIEEAGYKAVACAICSASTSLLCEQIKGQLLETILEWGRHFESEVVASDDRAWPELLRPFSCFEHLRVSPARRMCALLPWIALKSAALKMRSEDPVTS